MLSMIILCITKRCLASRVCVCVCVCVVVLAFGRPTCVSPCVESQAVCGRAVADDPWLLFVRLLLENKLKLQM